MHPVCTRSCGQAYALCTASVRAQDKLGLLGMLSAWLHALQAYAVYMGSSMNALRVYRVVNQCLRAVSQPLCVHSTLTIRATSAPSTCCCAAKNAAASAASAGGHPQRSAGLRSSAAFTCAMPEWAGGWASSSCRDSCVGHLPSTCSASQIIPHTALDCMRRAAVVHGALL